MLSDEQFSLCLFQQQPALRRLCMQLTRTEEVVDDLVQASLLEAWEHRQSLRDGRNLPQWLFAIARNVCKMWIRRKIMQQERAPLISAAFPGVDLAATADAEGEGALEKEVEHNELARLLDLALGHLPAETRSLLIEHYIEERSSSESALRLGIPLRTVQKRLERGKSAFRHLLQTEFYAELAPYLLPEQEGPWETTRLCCPQCGQHYLKARFSGGLVQFDCFHCASEKGPYITMAPTAAIRGYQRLLRAMMKTLEQRYAASLAAASHTCPCCGRPTPLIRNGKSLLLRCSHCHTINQNTLDFFALLLPQGRQFWQTQQRICLLPRSELEFAGQPALRIGYQSMRNHDTHEVFFARDTFEILSIQSTKGS